jgi:flagellin-like protein
MRRRGVSSIIGTIFFILIVFVAFTAISIIFNSFISYTSTLDSSNQAALQARETSVPVLGFNFGSSAVQLGLSNIPSGILYYVPMTLANSQASPLSGGTPVMLNLNWNTYSSYLDNPVDNLAFFDGSGNYLNAWIENGTSNTVSNSIVWVKLNSTGISAGGSTTIYMGFFATGSSHLSAAGPLGEAPQLTGTYAQYDDGSQVFSAYVNGNTPVTQFNLGTNIALAQATGVTYGSGTINALHLTGTGTDVTMVYSGVALTNVPLTAESNFETQAVPTSQGAVSLADNANPGSSQNAIAVDLGYASSYFSNAYELGGTYTFDQNQQGAGATTWLYSSVSYSGSSAVSWSGYIAPELYVPGTGYSGTVNNNPIGGASSIYLSVLSSAGAAYPDNMYYNWMRARISPPNGVMPTATLGGIVTAGATSTAATVSTSSAQAQPYVPITFTNSQTSATPNPFQQQLTWNPSNYGAYEASNLGNIRFCTSSSCGTQLYAWLQQCGTSITICSSSSTSAVAWVRLTSSIAANGGTLTIYMVFLPTSTNFDGNYWGEAPTLSGTYAQYDNGANVFTVYDNFAGGALSGIWNTASSSGYINVNNGITFTTTSMGLDGSTGAGTQSNSASASLTTLSANDVIIVTTGTSSSSTTVTSVRDSAGHTWTHRQTETGSPSVAEEEWYTIASTKLSSDSITVTWSASGDNVFSAFGISGANTASPFDTHSGLPAVATGTSTSPSVSVSTSHANDFIFGMLANEHTSFAACHTETLANGFSDIQPESSLGSNTCMNSDQEYQVVTSTQSNLAISFTTSSGGSNQWAEIGDAVQSGSSSTSGYSYIYSNTVQQPQIAEAYMVSVSGDSPLLGVETQSRASGSGMYNGYSLNWYASVDRFCPENSGGTGTCATRTANTFPAGIWSVYWAASGVEGSIDGAGTVITSTDNSLGNIANYGIYLGAFPDSSGSNTAQWARMRAYPPNNAMPAVSFGTLISGSSSATSYSFEHKVFYSQGLWWAFYSDGTNIGYSTSDDGSSWSSETVLTSSSGGSMGYDFNTWVSGNTFYYVLTSNGQSNSFLWRYGTLQSSGSVTWAIPETTVTTTNTVYSYNSVITDSSGNVWVALNTNDGTNTHIEVWKYSGTWSMVKDISPLPSDATPILASLSSGVALIYGEGSVTAATDITTTTTGITWSSVVAAPSNYLLFSSSATSIGNTVYFAGLSSGSTGATTGTVGFWSYSMGATSTSSQIILQGSNSNWMAAISEEASGTLIVFYGAGTSIYVLSSVSSGAIWSAATSISASETAVTGLTSAIGGSGAIWTSGSSSAFSVRFAALPTVLITNNSPFAVNLISLYINNLNANTLVHFDVNPTGSGVIGAFNYWLGAGETMSVPLPPFTWQASSNYLLTLVASDGVLTSYSIASPS